MKKRFITYSYPVLMSLTFFSIGYIVLLKSHPNEDAYILFKYAENLASGYGISFYKGGPPTEGATDFLWLILLSVLNWTGIDVAIAALILNSLGMFLISFFIVNSFKKLGQNSVLKVTLYSTASLILFLPFSLASYVGYSTTLYSALILAAFYLFIEEHKYLHFVPYLSLIISLFRPDGLIIGIGFVLLVYLKLRDKIKLKLFSRDLIISALIALLYFIWRWGYFKSFLPLPIYVKSNSAGLLNGLSWFINYSPVFTVFIFLYLFKKDYLVKNRLMFLGFLPLFLHIFFLTFALHLQNDFGRFQAPFVLVLYFSLIIVLIENSTFIRKYKPIIIIPLFLLCFSSGFLQARTLADIIKQRDFKYIDSFAYELKDLTDEKTVIALTEAGRLPFWSNSIIIDLVGLNTNYSAQHIPNFDYIKSINPDIIFYHSAGVLDLSRFRCTNKKVIDVTGHNLSSFIIERYKKYLDNNYNTYKEVDINNIKMAAIKTTEYVSKNYPSYVTYLVSYDGEFNHIFSFKNKLKNLDKIKQALTKANYNMQRLSYLMMKSRYE